MSFPDFFVAWGNGFAADAQDFAALGDETRLQIVKALRALRNKRATLPPKKHGNIPL